MIESWIDAHNHQRVRVTSTQGNHIQRNELRIEDRNNDYLTNYQVHHPIYNRLHAQYGHFQLQQVDDVEV